MGYYGIVFSNHLEHHGILGQKWGKKNGPPYPLDAGDHSASEKKAGWRKSLDGGSGLHYNDSPSFKIIKKAPPKPQKEKREFDKEKAIKIAKIAGTVAVAGLIAYGISQSGKYYCDSLMNDNPELFRRIQKGCVMNPNGLYDKKLWKSFSDDQAEAVHIYTSNYFQKINGILRKFDIYPKSAKDNDFKLINDLTDAIDKSSLKKEVVTFRGVSFDFAKDAMFKGIDISNPSEAKSLLGAVIQEDAFFSSSPKFQSQFAGGSGVKLTTICPPGTKALYVGKESAYPFEKELLLQRGTQFEILHMDFDERTGRLKEVIMQAIGTADLEPVTRQSILDTVN